MIGALWSEHCGYKHSRPLFHHFPTEDERILTNLGEENAGAIDIGDGWVAVMKIESHNHPSAIEPYEGAATGVGGIVRDIFAMGAQPIAPARFPALRPARGPAQSTTVHGRGRRYRRLRQLPRDSHRRRRTGRGRVLQRQSARQRDVSGYRAARIADLGHGRAARHTTDDRRRRHRPRRPARRDLRLGRAGRSVGRAATGRAGRQSLPREVAHGRLRGARPRTSRLARGPPGLRRGRHHLLDRRDGRAGQRRHSHPDPACAAARSRA